jgi:putative nucleotidyltransferase with HDIG domain
MAKDLRAILEEFDEVPALPLAVERVLRATEDPNTELDDVVNAIEQDPALSARVLRLSNSPYFGMRQRVGTVRLALVILGMREVRNIVLAVSVIGAVSSSRLLALVARDFWQHSSVTAMAARVFAKQLRKQNLEDAFVGGLLHDMGQLALAERFEHDYTKICLTAGSDEDRLCELEKEHFGFTHADVGAAFAQEWGLPDALRDALLMHHAAPWQPLTDAANPALAALVRLANRVARMLQLEISEMEFISTEGDVEAWDSLSEAGMLLSEQREDFLAELLERCRETMDTAGAFDPNKELF